MMMLVSDPLLVFLLCLARLQNRFNRDRVGSRGAECSIPGLDPSLRKTRPASQYSSPLLFVCHALPSSYDTNPCTIFSFKHYLGTPKRPSANSHTTNWLSLPSLITRWVCPALPPLLLGARYVSLNSQESSQSAHSSTWYPSH
jgi:hypothetical protein